MQGERQDMPFFPFCGKRCKTIDLGRWLGESYKVAEEPEGTDSDSPDEQDLP
jgi:endogenous inhibitor of DNA gyrase (YacG/DUF329 family)